MNKAVKKRNTIEIKMKYKVQFILIYIFLPTVLFFCALLAAGALINDIDFFGRDFTVSVIIEASIVFIGIILPVYLYIKFYLYGTFAGYYYACESRKFKKTMLKLFKIVINKYRKTAGNSNLSTLEKDNLKNLKYCAATIRKYRKYHLAGVSQINFEKVVGEEALNLKRMVFDKGFSDEKLAAEIIKVRFLIRERFIGISAYRGKKKYVFVSYSHKNAKTVTEVIKGLNAAEINVWFDEGIEPGENWMDHLAEKIDNCSHFLMFQSPSYVASVHCKAEINRAIKSEKKIIRIILDESKLPSGIEMYLDTVQAIDGGQGVQIMIDKLKALLKTPGKQSRTASRPQPADKKPKDA